MIDQVPELIRLATPGAEVPSGFLDPLGTSALDVANPKSKSDRCCCSPHGRMASFHRLDAIFAVSPRQRILRLVLSRGKNWPIGIYIFRMFVIKPGGTGLRYPPLRPTTCPWAITSMSFKYPSSQMFDQNQKQADLGLLLFESSRLGQVEASKHIHRRLLTPQELALIF